MSETLYKITDEGVVEFTEEDYAQHKAEQEAFESELPELLKGDLRSSREKLLGEADYTINTLVDQGADASAWRAYRQALRDITNQVTTDTTEIRDVTWPTKPVE